MSVIDYTNEYRQNGLPDNPMGLHHFADITDSQATLIQQIKDLQAQGEYDQAAAIITANDLQRYMMTSEYVNMIDEETRNLEIMCKANQQSIYFMEDEPGFASAGDVWISENEIND